MGADNWARCPRCPELKMDRFFHLTNEMDVAYGKVSANEFLELKDAVDMARRTADEGQIHIAKPTFRETWEISGAEDGEVTVRYEGHCTVCNLSLKFTDLHPLFPVPEA